MSTPKLTCLIKLACCTYHPVAVGVPHGKSFDFGDMLERYWSARLCALGAGVPLHHATPFRAKHADAKTPQEKEAAWRRNQEYHAKRALVLSLPLVADDAAALQLDPRKGGFDCRQGASALRVVAVATLVERETEAAISAFERRAGRAMPTPQRGDVAIHFRCGNVLTLSAAMWGSDWRLVKFAWYAAQIRRADARVPPAARTRRVLIIGQYAASNTKDDFVQESNANLAQCSVIMDALATFLRRALHNTDGRGNVEVVLGSSGLNEDFTTLVRAPLMLGSASRFSLEAALANAHRVVLPMSPLVGCRGAKAGLRWAVAPLEEFAPMAPEKNATLAAVIASLSNARPADYAEYKCSPDAPGCGAADGPNSCSFEVPLPAP